MPSKEVRDPIHGLIVLSPREWAVVASPPFQRLRGIQQLAMTYFVYPGARHSRWEHCVGAAHLAGRVAKDSLQLDEKEVERIRIAALSHDVGHGPFSHVSEEIFEKRTERKQVHESISAAIVRHHPAIRDVLGEETAEWVANLLSQQGHGARRSVQRDIVAGPSDVDKFDYLLRDSHYCGVKYGEYDLSKVVESTREIREALGGSTFLGFDISGIYALEEMLLARYHMHRQVYGHRTRVATDRMLVRAIELGIEEGVLPDDVFSPPKEADLEFVNRYLEWDDAHVTRKLVESEGEAGEVMRSLVERRLFKRVLHYDFEKLIELFDRPNAGDIAEPSKKVLKQHLLEAEELVARAVGVEPRWVSIYWADLENPIGSPFGFQIDGKEILVVDEEGRTREFFETSEVFSDTELRGGVRVEVYARLPNDQSPDDLETAVLERVKEATKEALALIGRAERDS